MGILVSFEVVSSLFHKKKILETNCFTHDTVCFIPLADLSIDIATRLYLDIVLADVMTSSLLIQWGKNDAG